MRSLSIESLSSIPRRVRLNFAFCSTSKKTNRKSKNLNFTTKWRRLKSVKFQQRETFDFHCNLKTRFSQMWKKKQTRNWFWREFFYLQIHVSNMQKVLKKSRFCRTVSEKNGHELTWTVIPIFYGFLLCFLLSFAYTLSEKERGRTGKKEKQFLPFFLWQAWELFIASVDTHIFH